MNIFDTFRYRFVRKVPTMQEPTPILDGLRDIGVDPLEFETHLRKVSDPLLYLIFEEFARRERNFLAKKALAAEEKRYSTKK